MATLSEVGSMKATDMARQEVSRAMEAGAPASDPGPKRHDSAGQMKAVKTEVTEATVRFTEGVDVITETLLLLLGKFNTLRRLTQIGMTFGGCVLITCLLLTIRIQRTAVLQENTTRDVADLTLQLKSALQKLDKIQQSTTVTEQKVDNATNKPSIEIVPDKGKPGKAKVVIRSAAPQSSPAQAAPKPAAGSAPPPAPAAPAPAAAMQQAPDIVEIPIQLPAK